MRTAPSRPFASLFAFTLAAGLAAPALAQSQPGAPASAPAPAATTTTTVSHPQVRTGDGRRDTMVRLMRPITVDFQEKRLEDIMTFIKDFTGADIEPLWMDDQNPTGLDKDRVVSVKIENSTALALLEKVLEKARGDSGGDLGWQVTESGTMQVGPKERLNKYKRVEIYDINDLLMELPNYRDVPRIDLQQALQAAQGGQGGGQSPFQEDQGNTDEERQIDRQAKADEIVRLLTELVENEQWVDNGGNGGTIRYFRGTIIVNAPDYMHRGINGYRWWPSASTRVAMVGNKKYVTLGTDQSLAKVAGFGQQPVSAVVGGQIIRSNSPGGGGR
ncbi:MAG: hypothetical protein WD749_10640 [Phycisphaerales bacterium]